MPNLATAAVIAATAATAAATAKDIAGLVEGEPSAPTFELAPLVAGGTPAVTVIRDLINEQTEFFRELLPSALRPLDEKVSAEIQIENLLTQLLAALGQGPLRDLGGAGTAFTEVLLPDLLGALRDFVGTSGDVSKILIPSLGTAADALFRIVEALIKGEALPKDSLLQIVREIATGALRVGGPEIKQWLGPLSRLIVLTLPKILSRRDLVDTAEDQAAQDLAPTLSEFGVAVTPAGFLPMAGIWKLILWVVEVAGPFFVLELLEKVGETFPALREKAAQTGTTTAEFFIEALKLVHKPVELVLETTGQVLLESIRDEIDALREQDPETVFKTAPRLLAIAGGLGLGAHIIATIAEQIKPLKQLGFPQLAAFLVDLSGFATVARNTIGVEFEAALRSPVLRHARSVFRGELPPDRAVDEMFLRRFLVEEDFAKYYREQGWRDEWIDRHKQSVFRKPRLFDLAQTVEDSAIPAEDIERLIRQGGFNDQDTDVLLRATLVRATKTSRAKYIDAVGKTVVEGFEGELIATSQLQSIGLRDFEIELLLKAWSIDRFHLEQHERRQAFLEAVASGTVSVDSARADVTTVGFDERGANHLIAVAKIKRSVSVFREEHAEVRSAIRRAQATRIQAALALHRRFEIDDAQLADILRGHAVNEDEIQPIVDLASVRRTPLPKLAETLSPEALAQRELQRREEQVLELQRNRVLDEATAVALLVGLGADDQEARGRAGIVASRLVRPPAAAEMRQEADAAREIRSERTAAAREAFRSGAVGAGALQTELIAAGHRPAAASAIVEREQARAASHARRTTTRQAQSQLAEVRRAREAAVVEAFRKDLIDDNALLANLLAVGQDLDTATAVVQRELARRVRRPRAAPLAEAAAP